MNMSLIIVTKIQGMKYFAFGNFSEILEKRTRCR